MITEEQFRDLQHDVERARQKADRARGALGQLVTQLKQEFGCDSLKDAKKLLESLRKDAGKAEAKFEKAFAEYQKKWESNDGPTD